jgi:hypothetical protein
MGEAISSITANSLNGSLCNALGNALQRLPLASVRVRIPPHGLLAPFPHTTSTLDP